MMVQGVLLFYYLIMQFVGFFTMEVDKRRAKKGQWRVPERRLWGLAWLGAGLGLWIGMHVFRHKTKHVNFRVGFPFFTVIHIFILLFIFKKLTG